MKVNVNLKTKAKYKWSAGDTSFKKYQQFNEKKQPLLDISDTKRKPVKSNIPRLDYSFPQNNC